MTDQLDPLIVLLLFVIAIGVGSLAGWFLGELLFWLTRRLRYPIGKSNFFTSSAGMNAQVLRYDEINRSNVQRVQ